MKYGNDSKVVKGNWRHRTTEFTNNYDQNVWDFAGQVGTAQDHVLKDKTFLFLSSDTEVAE